MRNLKVGAVLWGTGSGCLFLVGGFGPCGPSSEYGLLLILAGVPLTFIGWGTCIVGLARIAIKGQVELLMIPAVLATLAAMILPVALIFIQDDPGLALLGIWFWPVLTATGVLINDWRRRFPRAVNS